MSKNHRRFLSVLVVMNIIWGFNISHAAAAVDPVQIPNLNQEIIDHGIAAGRAYAAAHGWEDKCAGKDIVALTYANADQVLGEDVDGYANMDCSFVIDGNVTNPVRLCQVAEHEAIHEVRRDGWHDPDENSPVANGSPVVGPECAMYYPPKMAPVGPLAPVADEPLTPTYTTFTPAQAKRLIRKQLNKYWKIDLDVVVASNDIVSYMEFYAVRKIRLTHHTIKREKVFYVDRTEKGKLEALEMIQ